VVLANYASSQINLEANWSKLMSIVQTTTALDVRWRQAPSGELLDLGRVYLGPLSQSRLHSTPKRVLSRREVVLLGAFV
jgi:protein TonB